MLSLRAVSAADPSGLFGMLKESMASARALLQAKADPNADELMKAVAGDFETSEGRGFAQEGVKAMLAGAKPADIKAKAVAELSAVSALLASGVEGLLKADDASGFEIAPEEGAHDRCMIIDDVQSAILDPIAQRNHAAHPHSFLLRSGDLVPNPLARDLPLELREGQQYVERRRR